MHLTRTMGRRISLWALVVALFAAALALQACAPKEPTQPKPQGQVKQGTIDPQAWGDVWPQEYEDWRATGEPRRTGSKYKKGGESGGPEEGQYDKLSEYPYLAALTTGIGFSVEFNEPRGHFLALKDQNAIDPARLGAGGVCLACKTPYYERLKQDQGDKLLSMPYRDAVALIPQEHRDLGVSCASCHDEDAGIKYSALMADALKRIKVDTPKSDQLGNVVCGQCHSTYTIPKDQQKKSIGLFMPWDGGEYGDISIENIIETIESDQQNKEFTQKTTGLRLGYIRHPEFELFTRGDVHFRNGVTCVACHQPYKIDGDVRVSDHNVMSPLDNGMRACLPCHPGQSAGQLKDSVIKIQDEFIGAMLNAGYATVANARLIQMANESKIDTTSAEAKPVWDQAVADYKQAFYRVAYLNGENSVGFHNPPEAMRIAADALSYANRSSGTLRSLLEREGVRVPPEVELNLLTYLQNRGARKLQFRAEEEFRDPRGVAERLWQKNLAELRKGAPSQ